MVDRGIFFARARAGKLLGPTLTQSEVDGCTAILDAMMGAPLAYVAYALATAYLETAHTMQPIEEFGGPAYFFRMYDKGGNRPALRHSSAIPCRATVSNTMAAIMSSDRPRQLRQGDRQARRRSRQPSRA
jgi:putative chitinase